MSIWYAGDPGVSAPREHNPSDTTGASDASINVNQLWQTVLFDLESRISRSAFDNWFRQTSLAGVDNDIAVVHAPNAFSASTLQGRYASQVERALSDVIGRRISVEFTVNHEMADRPGRARAATTARAADSAPGSPPPKPVRRPERVADRSLTGLGNRQLVLESSAHGLVPRLTFETYVVGSSNRLAHAAAQAIAERPGAQYNPFFVHGGVGLGKTHLLHAVGHRALELSPDLKIMYVTSETFTNDVINAIRSQRMEDFRGRYRSIDILMVDDIQFIAGKESTQEEFFHTFNALYQNGKQVIVSSDQPPRSIAALEERMRSRFAGGLIADVQSPDFEMRTAILRTKAEELGVNMPPDVIEYIAHRDQTNIRELEGALNKILMMAQLYNRRLNLTLAMEALTDASNTQRRAKTTASDVVDAVVRHFKVQEKDLKGRQRTRDIVFPRQVAMYLLREETDISLEEIGRSMGGRDHTTVLHGIKKIESALDSDVQLRASLMAIREDLLTGQE
ncbi:MAG TPA: chromosomal replication initiator protein DnaA [Thermomicrobiales bacterium]|nr:chromosomal replication initiator protein DnaA [Thermomicrobiales bacterium]